LHEDATPLAVFRGRAGQSAKVFVSVFCLEFIKFFDRPAALANLTADLSLSLRANRKAEKSRHYPDRY
jgi:hypothetical protein